VITIGVTSIDESLKKVEAGGGNTVQPRTGFRWALLSAKKRGNDRVVEVL
jgi:predicted enzyme related to lactoylglutathione lyase